MVIGLILVFSIITRVLKMAIIIVPAVCNWVNPLQQLVTKLKGIHLIKRDFPSSNRMHACIHTPLPSIDNGRNMQVPSQSQQQQLANVLAYISLAPVAHAAHINVAVHACSGTCSSTRSSTCSTYSSICSSTCSSSMQAEWEGMTLPQQQKPSLIIINFTKINTTNRCTDWYKKLQTGAKERTRIHHKFTDVHAGTHLDLEELAVYTCRSNTITLISIIIIVWAPPIITRMPEGPGYLKWGKPNELKIDLFTKDIFISCAG